jgi:hypothetical protein
MLIARIPSDPILATLENATDPDSEIAFSTIAPGKSRADKKNQFKQMNLVFFKFKLKVSLSLSLQITALICSI